MIIRKPLGSLLALTANLLFNTLLNTATAAELDQWLRTDGHQRNPGTSADLIAAGLFAAMLAGEATFPITWASTLPWCS